MLRIQENTYMSLKLPTKCLQDCSPYLDATYRNGQTNDNRRTLQFPRFLCSKSCTIIFVLRLVNLNRTTRIYQFPIKLSDGLRNCLRLPIRNISFQKPIHHLIKCNWDRLRSVTSHRTWNNLIYIIYIVNTLYYIRFLISLSMPKLNLLSADLRPPHLYEIETKLPYRYTGFMAVSNW